MNYAYGRVSATDQNLARQIEEFRKFGIAEDKIFCDKKSGKDFERKNYKKLLKRLKAGDLLVIKSIDRLGRNYDAIIEEWTRITKMDVDILVLDMPLLDTRTKQDTLVGKFISDLVLQILSFVAENERINIRNRQAEGIALAKAKGVKFGRPKRILSPSFYEAARLYSKKSVSLQDALIICGMKKQTFYYHLLQMKKQNES